MAKGKLTPKQARFVDEYLTDLNATQAAKRAGYKDPSIGRQLITKNNVSEAIARRQENLKNKLEITQERILQEYARIGFLNLRDLFDEEGRLLPIHRIPDDAIRGLAGIETETTFQGRGDEAVPITIRKIKTLDKKGALDSLAKHLGMFVEKHEHSGPGGGPIETKITDFPPEPKTIAEWVQQREETEALRKAREAEGAEG